MITQFILLYGGSAEGGQGGGSSFFIFLGLFFVIIYFFMIRPQQKKAKDQRNFLANIQKGDKVVTIGGIHGKIVSVHDDSYLIEVDTNTKLKIEKSVISLEFTRALQSNASGNKN